MTAVAVFEVADPALAPGSLRGVVQCPAHVPAIRERNGTCSSRQRDMRASRRVRASAVGVRTARQKCRTCRRGLVWRELRKEGERRVDTSSTDSLEGAR